MKKFSQIKPIKIKKINEQQQEEEPKVGDSGTEVKNDEVVPNLPENIKGQEEEKKEETAGGDVVKFFSKLFESREIAHIFHLQVKDKGLAPHLALGDYYEDVIGLIDNLIEVWQGQYNIVEGYDVIDTKNTKGHVEYFEELAQFIKTERKVISAEDTHLHNIIDEIMALIYKTLYKLKYL